MHGLCVMCVHVCVYECMYMHIPAKILFLLHFAELSNLK